MAKISISQLFLKKISAHQEPERKEMIRSQCTIDAYKNKHSILCDFLHESLSAKFHAEKFNEIIAYKYYDWLLNKYSNNYAIRCVEICVEVLEYGFKERLLNDLPIRNLNFTRTKPKKPMYMKSSEIELWENYTSSDDELQKTAHLAILQIHTGFDYGDFLQISRDHISIFKSRKYIIKPRHKNRNEAIIPLNPKAEAILELYNYNMKLVSNPKYNRHLKTISIALGTDPNLKCKDLRKVFVMDQLNNRGISIEATSKMAGHSRIKTTEETYGQVNINLISDQLDRLGI